MKKKAVIIIEILFVVCAIAYYVVFEMLPEYKTKYGSSDKIINSDRYANMIEVLVDNNANISFVIDSEKNIYHILFFDKGSVSLYNKNLEGHTFNLVVDRMFQILISNNILVRDSIIEITRYEDKFYDEFLNEVKKASAKYNLNVTLVEKTSTIEAKANLLGISGENDKSTLSYMDYYSKEVIRKYKNNNLVNDFIVLNDKTSLKLSDNVYKKIEEYILKNNISNLDKDNTLLLIGSIPADSEARYYPDGKSWYYVKDNKVYAYIEFTSKEEVYGFCYNGSIDLRSSGECA